MQLKMLTVNELEKLNTKRLLGVLNSARAVRHSERNKRLSEHWCCEMCKEYLAGPETQRKEVDEPTAHLTNYVKRIKKVLATREHIK